MKHLNKNELEKLKVGNSLKCECEQIYLDKRKKNKISFSFYYLEIKSIKLGRNGYRIRTNINLKPKDTNIEIQVQNLFHLPQRHEVKLNFTINGAFSKDGIHNPGKNYLKRKYYLI